MGNTNSVITFLKNLNHIYNSNSIVDAFLGGQPMDTYDSGSKLVNQVNLDSFQNSESIVKNGST